MFPACLCVQEDWLDESLAAFQSAVENKELLMNVEYRVQGSVCVLDECRPWFFVYDCSTLCQESLKVLLCIESSTK